MAAARGVHYLLIGCMAGNDKSNNAREIGFSALAVIVGDRLKTAYAYLNKIWSNTDNRTLGDTIHSRNLKV